MWKPKTKVIPVVIGVLGMMKKGTQNLSINPWQTITKGNAENSTHRYCSHVSKDTAISDNTIT